MWYAGDRHTVHRLRTLPGAHLPSVFGDRRFRLITRAQEVARKKRELQRFIIVNSCTLTQYRTITFPTRTTIDPSRPLDYKLARTA
jgi:hypothetical protein